MVDRVVNEIVKWGAADGYFASAIDAANFGEDLRWIFNKSVRRFNSPVWFNVGTVERPQCSACLFWLLKDSLDSILKWGHDEGKIFQKGSGSGANLSRLRGSMEQLSKGGYSSGRFRLMKLSDGVANSIRSGGTTRRAAKMVVLDVDHPDIKDFIILQASCRRHG